MKYLNFFFSKVNVEILSCLSDAKLLIGQHLIKMVVPCLRFHFEWLHLPTEINYLQVLFYDPPKLKISDASILNTLKKYKMSP